MISIVVPPQTLTVTNADASVRQVIGCLLEIESLGNKSSGGRAEEIINSLSSNQIKKNDIIMRLR